MHFPDNAACQRLLSRTCTSLQPEDRCRTAPLGEFLHPRHQSIMVLCILKTSCSSYPAVTTEGDVELPSCETRKKPPHPERQHLYISRSPQIPSPDPHAAATDPELPPSSPGFPTHPAASKRC